MPSLFQTCMQESAFGVVVNKEFFVTIPRVVLFNWIELSSLTEGGLDALRTRGYLALSARLAQFLIGHAVLRPAGFSAAMEHAVLSPDLLAKLVARTGFYDDRGALSVSRDRRHLSDVFLIIVGASLVSLKRGEFKRWFNATFGSIVKSTIETYDEYHTPSPRAHDGLHSVDSKPRKRRRINSAGGSAESDSPHCLRDTVMYRIEQHQHLVSGTKHLIPDDGAVSLLLYDEDDDDDDDDEDEDEDETETEAAKGGVEGDTPSSSYIPSHPPAPPPTQFRLAPAPSPPPFKSRPAFLKQQIVPSTANPISASQFRNITNTTSMTKTTYTSSRGPSAAKSNNKFRPSRTTTNAKHKPASSPSVGSTSKTAQSDDARQGLLRSIFTRIWAAPQVD